MIVTKTPLRISLGGGGTDLPSYYKKYGGFIFSVCINKYVYACISTPFDDFVRLKYSENEVVKSSRLVRHKVIREALKQSNIENGIDIVSLADIPTGTGLGSSGAFTVTLLNALHKYTNNVVSREKLAEEACHIEMDLLRFPDGKQDPYVTALGGFTVLRIDNDGGVEIEKPKINNSSIQELKSNLLMFYTGTSRRSGRILREQGAKIQRDNEIVLRNMSGIKEIGYKVLDSLESGNIDDIGILFDEHWNLKKAISNKMSNKRFNSLYNAGKRAGALGAKLIGAGGGGFFLFYVNKHHKQFVDKMESIGLQFMDYNFDFDGTEIVMS